VAYITDNQNEETIFSSVFKEKYQIKNAKRFTAVNKDIKGGE
jgi:hypothetical protein